MYKFVGNCFNIENFRSIRAKIEQFKEGPKVCIYLPECYNLPKEPLIPIDYHHNCIYPPPFKKRSENHKDVKNPT
jgi:hypothetical protein